jgi:putative isomerase
MKTEFSRRSLLSMMAMAGGAYFAPQKLEAKSAAGSSKAASPSDYKFPSTHQADVAGLKSYFGKVAPQLFLAPEPPTFKYARISPSIPGKQYSGTLWDWDTVWTTRGLFAVARANGDKALRDQTVEYARGSLLNFLSQQTPEGRLPLLMKVDDPDAFHCADPKNNQAKPLFAQFARLIVEESGDTTWLGPVLDQILKHHDSWFATNKSQTGLIVWTHGLGIGDDNDPTTSGRPEMSSANVMLNSFMYEDLRAASELAGRLGKGDLQRELLLKADAFAALIRNVLWDPRDKYFYTADVQVSDDRLKYRPHEKQVLGMNFSYQSLPMRIKMFTGFLPLWCGLATPEQAELLLNEHYRRDDRFRCNFGVRSLACDETMYSLIYSGNPSNWLGPTWGLSNFFVWHALKNYGTQAEADELAAKTVRLLANDLALHGTLNEYYHPDTGEAISLPGFIDWNMLVLEMVAG